MLLKLKIDSHSQKGKNFKIDCSNIDVEDPKIGIVHDSNCCSCLLSCSNDAILTCCTCDSNYHASCIKRPVSKDMVKTFNDNPNCWWSCLDCLANLPVNFTSQPRTDQTSDFPISLPEVKKCLTEFKDKLLSEVNTLISNRIPKHLPHQPKNDDIGTKRKRGPSDEDEVFQSQKVIKTYIDLTNDTRDNLAAPSSSINLDINPANLNRVISDSKISTSTNSRLNPISAPFTTNEHIPRPHPIVPRTPFKSTADNQKFILHYRPITQDLALKSLEEWHETRKSIGRKLNTIQISFSKFNVKNGHVKMGFPTQEHMNRAKVLIADCLSEDFWSYEHYTPELLLPKVTIYNIPLDFDLPSDLSPESCSAVEFRDAVKDQLINSIVEKNDGVKSLIDSGSSTLEVVYVQKHRNTCTAALKLSPELRDHIMKACNAKLYVFSARCRIEDRFFYRQCFHCQKLGHISKSCPNIHLDPICMYCSGHHLSRDCTVKKDKSQHCCSNCRNSTDQAVVLNATTHNASSPLCPITVSFINDHVRPHTQNPDLKNH